MVRFSPDFGLCQGSNTCWKVGAEEEVPVHILITRQGERTYQNPPLCVELYLLRHPLEFCQDSYRLIMWHDSVDKSTGNHYPHCAA